MVYFSNKSIKNILWIILKNIKKFSFETLLPNKRYFREEFQIEMDFKALWLGLRRDKVTPTPKGLGD